MSAAAHRTCAVVSRSIVRDRSVKYAVDSVGDSHDVAALARAMIGSLPTESLIVVSLGPRGGVLSVTTVAAGGVGACSVSPSDVFRAAIVAGASRIALAHNHPSGDATPSADDVRTTERLVEAGKLLGVQVVDHVVVTDERCTSMLDGKWARFS